MTKLYTSVALETISRICDFSPAKTMDQLLQLPFSEEEERHLVAFLKASTEPQVKELLVLYYLQRARFTEAIRLNTQLQESFVSGFNSLVLRSFVKFVLTNEEL